MEALYLKGVVSAQKRDEAEAQYKAMVATESVPPARNMKWCAKALKAKTKRLLPPW